MDFYWYWISVPMVDSKSLLFIGVYNSCCYRIITHQIDLLRARLAHLFTREFFSVIHTLRR